MEMFLDKNGTSLQRRKMYVGFPLHNMKSHVQFDWQNNNPSIQDQMGKRYKLNQEKEQLTKKYNDIVTKKIYSKYVQLSDDNQAQKGHVNQKEGGPSDILTQEVQQFDKSKVMSSSAIGNPKFSPKHNETSRHQNPHKERLNQSLPHNLPPYQQHQYDQRKETINFRYDQSYNPENYKLSPSPYRTVDLQNYPQEIGSKPSKFVEKMYTGSAPIQYSFRNVIPDKLETHLRDKMKAERKKEVKMNLNLFDYYTRR